MGKTKLDRKFHKIRVHHNRWLIWTIAYLVFVAIAMLGYLKIANLDLENSGGDFNPTHSYKDERLAFGLRYPADWSIESTNSSISFLPSATSDEGVSVTVTTLAAEKSIIASLEIIDEESINISDTAAKKLVNKISQGHTETVVLAQFEKQLYVIRGSSGLVDKILETFYFVKN